MKSDRRSYSKKRGRGELYSRARKAGSKLAKCLLEFSKGKAETRNFPNETKTQIYLKQSKY